MALQPQATPAGWCTIAAGRDVQVFDAPPNRTWNGKAPGGRPRADASCACRWLSSNRARSSSRARCITGPTIAGNAGSSRCGCSWYFSSCTRCKRGRTTCSAGMERPCRVLAAECTSSQAATHDFGHAPHCGRCRFCITSLHKKRNISKNGPPFREEGALLSDRHRTS